jgi:hypothetical protein
MKELKIMKTTLRYLLMVVAMVSVLGVSAQSTAQLPEPKMQSTSVMLGTGTTLPFAAAEGTYVTGSTPGTYSPTGGRPGHIRKGLDDDDEGEGGSTPKPGQPFPIGDGLWVLILAAAVYGVYRRKRV